MLLAQLKLDFGTFQVDLCGAACSADRLHHVGRLCDYFDDPDESIL